MDAHGADGVLDCRATSGMIWMTFMDYLKVSTPSPTPLSPSQCRSHGVVVFRQ